MDSSTYTYFLQALRGSIKPSTGCTEPGAIALNTATARAHAKGAFKHLTLRLDEFLYKNAMCVGIPGTSKRGIALCAAIGITAGDASAGFNVLHTVTPQQAEEAERLVAEKRVTVAVCSEYDRLFVQSVLETDEDSVRVTTLDRHDNITDVCHAPFLASIAPQDGPLDLPILQYTLEDMLVFVREVPFEELLFLQEGVDMNLAMAEAGGEMSLGRAMRALMARGALGESPATRAKVLCATAAYARMSGTPLPVMSATGSGNQGITVTMTIEGVAQALDIPQETKLRALSLAHLVNMYSKAHIGSLSALCACGISSGLGASVAIVYMLGGTPEQMLLAVQNMIGSICGMICDGAKEGCANKVELAAGMAVESAYLAMEGVGIPHDNGILSNEWKTLFENLGALAREGMREANRVIVKIMQKGEG